MKLAKNRDIKPLLSVRFLFIGEGPSDSRLVHHLERCCILAGADEAEGLAPDFSRLPEHTGNTVAAKLDTGPRYETDVDFVFVHRDADSRDPEPRYSEIGEAVESASEVPSYVAIIPIRATESWLLLDEAEIRWIAENPNGRISLDLPSPRTVENIADPKSRFEEVVLEASEQTGRRRQRLRSRLQKKKNLLISKLDPKGPVSETSAWKRMFNDLKLLVNRLGD